MLEYMETLSCTCVDVWIARGNPESIHVMDIANSHSEVIVAPNVEEEIN